MEKKTSKSSSDLKNLDLENLVKDAKEQEVESSESNLVTTDATIGREETPVFPQSWNSFLSFLVTYKNQKKKERLRSFYIENEIIDVLENCSIEKSKTTDIINGILRSFIEEHKAQFRANLKPRPTLISLEN